LSCVSSTSYTAFKVTITGRIHAEGISLAGAPISLSYSITSGTSWQDLTLVYTDTNGAFGAVWTPLVTGNYLIKAAMANTIEYAAAETIVNFAVMPFTEQTSQNVFSVTSNSTVSSLAFNSTSRILSFSIAGDSGTTGYATVYITKTIVQDAERAAWV